MTGNKKAAKEAKRTATRQLRRPPSTQPEDHAAQLRPSHMVYCPCCRHSGGRRSVCLADHAASGRTRACQAAGNLSPASGSSGALRVSVATPAPSRGRVVVAPFNPSPQRGSGQKPIGSAAGQQEARNTEDHKLGDDPCNDQDKADQNCQCAGNRTGYRPHAGGPTSAQRRGRDPLQRDPAPALPSSCVLHPTTTSEFLTTQAGPQPAAMLRTSARALLAVLCLHYLPDAPVLTNGPKHAYDGRAGF